MNGFNPIVTVIMPMKNAADYVYDAILSVINQEFKDFELLVVDDGSTDLSRKIAESFADNRVKVLIGPETGAADAFNLALTMAKGKYVCNCDADDLFPEDRLSWQVKWLDEHEDFDAICATYSTMDSKAKVLSKFNCGTESTNISDELLQGITRTSFCTFLMRGKALMDMNGYRSYFVSSYDIDLQLRMAGKYKIWYEPKNAYFYRLHDSSITHTQASNKRTFFEQTARECLKQRIAQGQDDIERGHLPLIPDFDVQASSSRHQISGILTSEAWRLHREGYKLKAIKKGLSVCSNKPFDYKSWRNLVALIIK